MNKELMFSSEKEDWETPQEFFDEGNANPEGLNEFIAQARQLDSRSFEYILGIMKELNTKR